ncbi:ABC transporter substrate-binding protein [Nocardioides zhouii]|uniref:Extracellular solute-binding protein n=1 Tax=Nocardioides zhouii TaxID=1168729 RepID=A0A4Q2SUT9_9ACTN|nr:extracellular solute-binding protein [Nocardioides zhouii]RYC09552.1 extracellular solute-binding protein [Nocardioides zhouii]
MLQRGTRRKMAATAAAATLALTAAACGGDDSSGSDDGGAVTIWMSLDATVVEGLQKQIDIAAKEAGIEVKIERVDGIDKLIKTKIQAGDTPDIALLPQPGVVASVVELGAAFPLDDVLDTASLEETMVAGALDAGKVDDELYGLLVSMNVKSLIFYPKKAFEEAGYAPPESLDELTELADQIKSDGGTPWCLTMESGDATGWVATDWMEDLVMRYGGVDAYNDWVTHDLPFTDPVVKEAAAYFEDVALTEGNVLGGQRSITATPFTEAAKPMFDEGKPGCWLLKQGSFFTGPDFLPEDVYANLDDELGVTAFPPVEAGGENPVMGGGDLAVLMNDSEDAKTAMNLLATADIGNDAAPVSSFLSPHTDFDTSLYPNETSKSIAQVAYDSTAFLFDGSDSMPAEVGAGSFWKEMTAWLNGDEDIDTALQNIDDSWPSS